MNNQDAAVARPQPKFSARTAIALCAFLAATALAEPSPSPPETLEVYTAPQQVKIVPPVYPKGQIVNGAEGWVYLNFMVSDQGQPYEISVSDSSGNAAFEKAAIKAISQSVYQPAAINGEALDAGAGIKMRFQLSTESSGARPWFGHKYKRLTKAITSDDQPKADRLIAEINSRPVLNLYEDAFMGMVMAAYYQRWGNVSQQRAALRRAVAYESDEVYLPEATFVQALKRSMRLAVQQNDFRVALALADTLESRDIEPAFRAQLATLRKEVEVLRTGQDAYAVSGEISSNASWFLQLLKSSFYIDQLEGELAEIKLRCERDYVFFRYQPDQQYRIADQQGQCALELVGNPGSTFRVVQR